MSAPSISMHQGGANTASLGEREVGMRRMWDARTAKAIIEELPIYEYAGKRVFRIPRLTGFSHAYDMQPATIASNGAVVAPSKAPQIKFETGPSGNYGQIILDPDKPEDVRKIAVIEKDLMKNMPWLGIVDWEKAKREAQEEEDLADVMRLADPSRGPRIAKMAKKLGVSLASGFSELLGGQQKAE